MRGGPGRMRGGSSDVRTSNHRLNFPAVAVDFYLYLFFSYPSAFCCTKY